MLPVLLCVIPELIPDLRPELRPPPLWLLLRVWMEILSVRSGLVVVRVGGVSAESSTAWVVVVVGDEGRGEEEVEGVISTSSASRYHLRRRVYFPQPSRPRRPFCH